MDLANTEVRRKMVSEARWLVTECGFDGVQWDYEICADGDTNLLSLLDETRAALPSDALLGVATPLLAPGIALNLGYGWSDTYYGEVAKRCDQIAVMGYDSGIYLPRAYVWLMQTQTTQATRAALATNPDCRVLIGVPTYGRGGPSHHLRAENIENALRGVRLGYSLLNEQERRTFAGVVPFADYTTQDNEWNSYRALWLEGSGQK